MTNDDSKKFCSAWSAAMGVYGKTVEPQTLAIVFRCLQEYELAEVEQALAAHLKDPEHGKFPPKPADIVRAIEGDKESLEAIAWANFRYATRSGDMPNDPVMVEVIRRMGGLDYLGDKNSRDVDFMETQFKALYWVSRKPETLGIALLKTAGVLTRHD